MKALIFFVVKWSSLFYCLIAIPYLAKAQKNMHILDAFYQALAQDSTEEISFDLAGGEFLMDTSAQEISPQKIIERHPDAKKYLIQDSIFHIRGLFDIGGNIIDKGAVSDPSISIKNIHFDYFEPNLNVVNPSQPNEIFYGSYLGFENVKVYTQIRSSGGGNIQYWLRNSDIKDLTFALVYPPSIKISDSKIDFLVLAVLETDDVLIENCTINKFSIQDIQTARVRMQNNIFTPPLSNDFKITKDSSTYLREAIFRNEPFKIINNGKTINRFELTNNHFKTTEQDPELYIKPMGGSAFITGNTFDLCVRMSNRTSYQFKLTDNKFSTVSFSASLPSTPQNSVKIDWPDLSGKLVWKANSNTPTYYGKNDLELENTSAFNSLISSYGKLVEVFKNNRNTMDANNAYLEMKAFESARFRYVYEEEGGSDNWFRLKLHQLLSIYTRHGTDPAQAMTASVWLIFLFSILYFFFPSDWDAKSKPQLIADFRTLVQKNEQGYFWPFMSLAKGLLVSMFNAFILSVNSFVTLGFGRIPTKGLAKYICILEGFLGWFLLSIFIVSLINQVLF